MRPTTKKCVGFRGGERGRAGAADGRKSREFAGGQAARGSCAGWGRSLVSWRSGHAGLTNKSGSALNQSIPVPSSPLAAPPERPSVRARLQRREALLGALCVVGSAVAFSAKAVIAKVGYRHGADPA